MHSHNYHSLQPLYYSARLIQTEVPKPLPHPWQVSLVGGGPYAMAHTNNACVMAHTNNAQTQC